MKYCTKLLFIFLFRRRHFIFFSSHFVIFPTLCICTVINIYTAFVQTEMVDLRLLTSICGAEWKNGKELCVNYFKRRDLYEKTIIFTILTYQMSFQMHKYPPLPFVFPYLTNNKVIVWVAFGRKRPFNKKLSLGTGFPSQLKANNL